MISPTTRKEAILYEVSRQQRREGFRRGDRERTPPPDQRPSDEDGRSSASEDPVDDSEEGAVIHMTNNERFNQLINQSSDPRRMMNALRLFAAKPRIEQPDPMFEESQIGIRELLPLLDVPQLDEQIVGLV